jgi:flagellar biogenesis protein FliO
LDSVNFMAAATFKFSLKPILAQLTELGRRTLRFSGRPGKSLKLHESLPLGERRFVAVVEFEQERFLIGGTSSSVVLLSRLADSRGKPESEPSHGKESYDAAEVQTRVNALWSGGVACERKRETC